MQAIFDTMWDYLCVMWRLVFGFHYLGFRIPEAILKVLDSMHFHIVESTKRKCT